MAARGDKAQFSTNGKVLPDISYTVSHQGWLR